MIVPPGSDVTVKMFVVPLHPAAELEHTPCSGPHVNDIRPIGVPSGNPSTEPIAYSFSVVENVSPGSPAGGCMCRIVASWIRRTLKVTGPFSLGAADADATTASATTSRKGIRRRTCHILP